MMDIIAATEVYYYYNLLRIFWVCIETGPASSKHAIPISPNMTAKDVLTKLCQLLGLSALSKLAKELLVTGLITGKQANIIKDEVQGASSF